MDPLPEGQFAALFDAAGLLTPGPERYEVDETVILEPWPVTLAEARSVLGGPSETRAKLADRLAGFMLWWEQITHEQDTEVWLTGSFASTLDPEADELSVVAFCDWSALTPGDRWALQIITGGALSLHPGILRVTPIRTDHPEFGMERDREAKRARVATPDPVTGNSYQLGWPRIVHGGATI